MISKKNKISKNDRKKVVNQILIKSICDSVIITAYILIILYNEDLYNAVILFFSSIRDGVFSFTETTIFLLLLIFFIKLIDEILKNNFKK